MKRLILASVIAFMLVGAATPTLGASATCLVRVNYDPEQFPLNAEMLDVLLRSPGVLAAAIHAEPAIRQRLEEEQASIETYVSVSFVPLDGQQRERAAMMGASAGYVTGPGMTAPARGTGVPARGEPDTRLIGQIVVEMPQDDDTELDAAAARLLKGICERLEATLAQASEQDMSRLREALAMAESEVREADKRLHEIQVLQTDITQQVGGYVPDSDELNEQLRYWQREGQKLRMEIAVRQTRQEALTEQISKIGGAVESRAAEDAVAQQLKLVTQLREQELERVHTMAKSGVAPESEVRQAEENLAMARAELAERQQRAASAAGGDMLNALNHELIDVAVDMAEQEVRLSLIGQQIKEVSAQNLLELAGRYEREVALRLPVAREMLMRAVERQSELQRSLRNAKPITVTRLGVD
ncbi:MAG: hypothetical protein JXO22_17055 [Phycisphaerae bacterium]|nr:hypothetical protein [Phycisphaerae bacterium]